MQSETLRQYGKVPAVTLGFWIIKILATTLGETGGDTLSMTMNLGYLAATGIFAVLLIALVTAAIIDSSEQRFLVADASKWLRPAAVKVVPFSRMSRFFTDHLPDDPSIADKLRQSGVDVVLCGSETS